MKFLLLFCVAFTIGASAMAAEHHHAAHAAHTAPSASAPKTAAPSPPPAAQDAAAPAATSQVGEAATPPSATAPEPQKGSVTGLKLPRFAALRSDLVYMRKGPGMRYPIEWVYKRRDLPVEILREFDVWRLVQDQDGIKGWIHQATLTGRRSLLVTSPDQALHSSADGSAPLVARLQPGVIGRLKRCDSGAGWCEAQIKGYQGWINRHGFWGAEADEAVQ